MSATDRAIIYAELLKQAKARIDTPDKWTQGANARNESGDDCDIDDSRACRFCMLGAVYAISPHRGNVGSAHAPNMLALLGRSIRAEHDPCNTAGAVTLFNDQPDRTHADVMRVFDRAITEAEKL